jgi:hypothetical protein
VTPRHIRTRCLRTPQEVTEEWIARSQQKCAESKEKGGAKSSPGEAKAALPCKKTIVGRLGSRASEPQISPANVILAAFRTKWTFGLATSCRISCKEDRTAGPGCVQPTIMSTARRPAFLSVIAKERAFVGDSENSQGDRILQLAPGHFSQDTIFQRGVSNPTGEEVRVVYGGRSRETALGTDTDPGGGDGRFSTNMCAKRWTRSISRLVEYGMLRDHCSGTSS